MTDEFKFTRPQEAPTFFPTEDEFADPLGYINKIRPKAERFGICKIRPPSNWAPPFAVDVDKFKFVPRIQKINELEAITRIKLNFLDQISKFWELQGTSLRIPVFGHKALDLYTLHQLVHSNDFKNPKYTEEKKWNLIAGRMGLQSNGKVSVGTQLKAHYDKILYPYDVWKSNQGKKKETPQKRANTVKSSRMGGRMGGPKKTERFDPLANYICQNCKGGDVEDKMLLCDGCDDSYHTFCLKPPLDDVPKGEWRCPDCLEEKLSRPNDGFGFEQAQKEYTLQQFGEMADDFKSTYFNMPVHMVSSEMVEKEFWRIVSAIDEDVTVEYGADLHTMDHGSGFPTVSNSALDSDEMYINSGWNLNKLPVLKGSVFAHINADISGMKIPWMYVGMCFSTFCWHNEDHWSYSINYLHWGEPKTWYGVPGGRADDFENAMKSAAPELFAQAPDLLHQLVTIMNPNILMRSNVPVYRMDQKAGEFIITFPRAYHAGFNQGYNFAEAVNFAPADWVQMGRECVNHYAKLNRFCVFSHDELVCAMALQPDKLDISIALATHKDILKMFAAEKEQRKDVFAWGVKGSEKVDFEHLADDGRQCNVCKTTLYLSAVACIHAKGSSAKDTKLVCLKHYDQYGCKDCLKDPALHILKYRYTIDELQEMITGLGRRTGQYEKWLRSLSEGLDNTKYKLSLEQLRDLVEEARKNDYPSTELMAVATKVLEEAERTCKIAKELIGTPAVRTRKGGAAEMRFKCSMDELKMLANEMSYLRVTLSEMQHCVNLYHKACEIQQNALDLLRKPVASIDEMQNCIQEATSLDVGFEEIFKLKRKYEREKWLRIANKDDDEDSIWTMDYLRKIIEEGNEVHRNEAAEKKMEELCRLYEKAYEWEVEASKLLSNKNGEKYLISKAKEFIESSESIHVALPSLPHLREIITKATNWLEKVKHFQHPNVPFLDDLINVVDIGEALPIQLDYLKPLRTQVTAANIWRENCMKVFLKRNSTIELIEALAPRADIPTIPQRGRKRRLVMEGPSLTFIGNLLGIPPPDVKNENALVEAYWRNVTTEVIEMKALRRLNIEKFQLAADENKKFCVCQKPKDSFMIRCELCLEWFHPTCVPLPRIPSEDPVVEADSDGIDTQAIIAYRIACRETKYLGPCCSRSRRPEYKYILELLVGLHKLPLLMVEGVALQCLTNRAMKWQEECDKLFQNEELKDFVELVRRNSSAIPTSSKQTTDNENEACTPSPKIFFNPALIAHSSSTENTNGHSVPEEPTIKPLNNLFPASRSDSGISVGRDKEVDIAMILAGMGQEVIHPSTPSQSDISSSESVSVQSSQENGHSETNGLKPETTKVENNVPKIQFSPELLDEMENLLIEADLMEVFAEDSDILWKLYDLAKPTVVEKRNLREIQQLIQEEISNKGLVSWDRRLDRKRKRSLNEDGKRKSVSPRKRKFSGDKDNPAKQIKQENQECDEDCSAPKCRQPTGKEVVWIQCDGCDQWFHLSCVGLKKSQVKNLDHYTCVKCVGANPANVCDADDGSSCDTDSKLSSSGQLSISSNKENTHRSDDSSQSGLGQVVVKEEHTDSPEKEFPTNSLNVFSKVN